MKEADDGSSDIVPAQRAARELRQQVRVGSGALSEIVDDDSLIPSGKPSQAIAMRFG